MADNEANRALLADSGSHSELLDKVKQLGIQPFEDNSQLVEDDSEATFGNEHLLAVNDATVVLRSLTNPETSSSSARTSLLTKKDQRSLSGVASKKRPATSIEDGEMVFESSELGASGSNVVRVRENQCKTAVKIKKTNTEKPKKVTKAAKDHVVEDVLEDEQSIFQVEHRLLEEVFENPPLFNIKLDLKKRTPERKQAIYNMIAESLNDEFEMSKLNWKVVENTFTLLRTNYIRYTNALKLPSGSGANRMPAKPKHYEILRQNDVLKDRRVQTSSLSPEGFELQPPKGRPNKSSKTENPEEFATLMKSANQYFDNLNNPTPTTVTANKEKEPANNITSFPINCDPDVTFLLTILPSMKELPKAAKRKFQHEVMGKLNEELERSEGLND